MWFLKGLCFSTLYRGHSGFSCLQPARLVYFRSPLNMNVVSGATWDSISPVPCVLRGFYVVLRLCVYAIERRRYSVDVVATRIQRPLSPPSMSRVIYLFIATSLGFNCELAAICSGMQLSPRRVKYVNRL